MKVVGRFAPSPTGPLHAGSLVAALASFLEAKTRNGRWHLRIDDLDPPREQAGAADGILKCLAAHGLTWDGPVTYQSRHEQNYLDALERLRELGATFPCGCTRREVGDGPYPGTCKFGLPAGKSPRSIRFHATPSTISFRDRLYGAQRIPLHDTVGDFIVRRADGLFAYHLAAVVDDFELGVTDIVRGADLLGGTACQLDIMNRLGYPPPTYAHIPCVEVAPGKKLSKQTGAKALDKSEAARNLVTALSFLRQGPELDLTKAPPQTVIEWAVEHWDIERISVTTNEIPT